jgi:hypothetical protein
LKKHLNLILLVFFVTSLGIYFSNTSSNFHINNEHYNIVLNEQIDDQQSPLKNDDKKQFFMVLSVIFILLTQIINLPLKLRLGFKHLKKEFLTSIFYKSNYVVTNLFEV